MCWLSRKDLERWILADQTPGTRYLFDLLPQML